MFFDGAYDDDQIPRVFTGSNIYAFSVLRNADESVVRVRSSALHSTYWQRGGSIMGGMSGGGGAAASYGGMVGGAAGVMSSIGGAYTTSSGTRKLTADTMQNVADAVHQTSSATRELRSSVVVQTDEKESQSVPTRMFFNNNRGHTMTILYYEVLRHYKLVVRYKQSIRGVLVDRTSYNFKDRIFLLSKRYILQPSLLDLSLAPNWDALRRADAADKEIYRNPPTETWYDEGTWVISSFIFEFTIEDDSTNGLHVVLVPHNDPSFELTVGGNGNFNATEQLNNEQVTKTFETDPVNIQWGSIKNFTVKKTSDDGVNPDFVFTNIKIRARGGFAEKVLRDSPGAEIKLLGKSPDAGSEAPLNIFPPAPKRLEAAKTTWEQSVQKDDYALAMQLIDHLDKEKEYYSRIVDLSTHPNEYARTFETTAWSSSQGGQMIDYVSPVPAEILGSKIAFPLAQEPLSSDQLRPRPAAEERLISFPTKGVFADAKLGHCNVAEEIDETRFWRWDEHPNPMLAAESNPITMKTPEHVDVSGTLGVSQMPNATVNITNPLQAPDPTGMAQVLNAITKGDSFRDMSATTQVAGMLANLTDAAVKMAQTAASMVKPGAGGSGTDTPSSGSGSTPAKGFAPITTTKEQQTTPKETKDAIDVINGQVAKGNMTKEQGQQAIGNQVGNMKGSKPVEEKPKGTQRGLVVRFIGQGSAALVGRWSWELTQQQIVGNEMIPAGLAGDETPRVFEHGQIVANFLQDPNTKDSYDLAIRGRLLGTRLQFQDLENIPANAGTPVRESIHIVVPEGVFKSGNVATATVTAAMDKWESSRKNGREATKEFKAAGGVNPEVGGEFAIGEFVKLFAKASGSASGERSWGETESEETEQIWTFWFYSGGFEQNVKVD